MARRKAKKSGLDAFIAHPFLGMQKVVVGYKKWRAHQLRTARANELAYRKAQKEIREVKLVKTQEKDARRKARITAGAVQDQERTAPQTVRVKGQSAAAQARVTKPATARVAKPRAAAKQVAASPAPAQAGTSPVGLCGHKTDRGAQCKHPVTRGGTCAAGHRNGMVRQVAGRPSAWAAKPPNKIPATGMAQKRGCSRSAFCTCTEKEHRMFDARAAGYTGWLDENGDRAPAPEGWMDYK